ncbi:putative Late embryogenesis abundant protein, LEA-14 [Rosa chinensis]|uniref:Putative Late embryogenesis abundant protein, LEA-14 n=1 Tax=Rosa chinensis TaxID=74649 RepID=A0A2P6RBS8_ROSCH|nr:putative Late embryogenesis abundant protein, LEA-14 [Rosa chinensis]
MALPCMPLLEFTCINIPLAMTCSMTCNGKKLTSCTILSIFTAIAVLAGVIAFVVIFSRSPKLEVTVTNASMTQFNLNSNNNTLYYNLALDVAIRNPSPTFRVHYNRIEVAAKYREQKFALVTLSSPPFDQGTKNITILHPLLQGQPSSLETDAGIYSIDLQFSFRISRRVLKGIVYKPVGMCMLKVPSSSNETTPGSSFKATECLVTRH